MKGLTGFWSKYGGARDSPFLSQHETTPDTWTCQSCAKLQVAAMGMNKYHIDDIGWINVCGPCKFNNCRELQKRRRCEP